jgi:hypothetical protein
MAEEQARDAPAKMKKPNLLKSNAIEAPNTQH